jgi:hypothetical protein
MLSLLLVFLVPASRGFFHADFGLFLLVAGYMLSGATAFFLLRQTGANLRALAGSKGRFKVT